MKNQIALNCTCELTSTCSTDPNLHAILIQGNPCTRKCQYNIILIIDMMNNKALQFVARCYFTLWFHGAVYGVRLVGKSNLMPEHVRREAVRHQAYFWVNSVRLTLCWSFALDTLC